MFYQKLMSLGLGVSANYKISNNQLDIHEVSSALFYYSLMIGFIPSLFFLFYGFETLSFILKDVVVTEWLLWIIIITIPSTFLSSFFVKILLSQENVVAINKIKLIVDLLPSFITVFLLLSTNMTLSAAIVSYAMVNVLVIPLILFYYIKIFRKLPLYDLKFSVFTDLLAYGYKVFIRNIIGFLHYRIDIYLIAILMPVHYVAFYKLASSFSEKIWLLNATHLLLISRVASSKNKYGGDLTARVFKNTFWLMAITAFGGYLVSPFVITVIYGDEYTSIVSPFQLLLPGVVLLGACSSLSQYFIGKGLVGWTNYVYFASLGGNVALNLMLIPQYGISGAAIATLITYSISTVFMIILFVRESSINFIQLFMIDKADISQYKYLFKVLKQSIRI